MNLAPTDDEKQRHELDDPHVRSRWLSDVVLGAQDGLVNTLAVVLAVAAASRDTRIVLASGFAAALAEAVSMGAVAYTSSSARADLFRSERAREYRHLETAPHVERDEIRRLYAAKGFADPLLERVVDTICSNRDVWVAVMMAEEHKLAEIPRAVSLRAAAIVGLSALVAAIAPIVPFGVFGLRAAVAGAIACGAALLFGLGAFKARVTTVPTVRGGVELLIIGLGSAAIGYGIGALLAP